MDGKRGSFHVKVGKTRCKYVQMQEIATNAKPHNDMQKNTSKAGGFRTGGGATRTEKKIRRHLAQQSIKPESRKKL